MNYFYATLLTGLLVHLSPLSAEESSLFVEEEFNTHLSFLEEMPTAVSEEAIIEAMEGAEPEEALIIDAIEPLALTPAAASSVPPAPPFQEEVALLNIQEASVIGEPVHISQHAIVIDLKQAFSGSPLIYSVLLALSIFSLFLWLYSLSVIRRSTLVSYSLLNSIQNQLGSNNFEEALDLCKKNNSLVCKMLSQGILSRKHGFPVILDSMKTEAKRSSVFFWQKIGLLNDVAIIAPMLGLLGTVMGMFYAFYDVNRSIESISTLFDGLGISVGTTVAGLVVAILALILHSTAKYKLIRALATVENEAQNMAVLLDDKTHIYKG